MLSDIELRHVEDAGSEAEQVAIIMRSRSLGYDAAYDVIARHFGASLRSETPASFRSHKTEL